MSARPDTREQILDAAETLLQQRGFNAFSYQNISQPLGIRNAAVHYHFPTKGNLGAALIDRYRRRFHAWVAAHRRRGSDPATLLNGYFAIPLNYLRHDNCVCPLGVLEAEFNAIPDDMRVATRALDAEIREFLAGVLRDGREQGQFQFAGLPEAKALVVVAALQGALQIARVAGPTAFRDTLRQLKCDLGMDVRSATAAEGTGPGAHPSRETN
ncbi:MAG: TetR/AcrR family transcriptional regulator [Pseudomonadota bacterium]|nr:MAG: TetR/AcrR family transcriptional regulator [Pseudomonadota bacterium]